MEVGLQRDERNSDDDSKKEALWTQRYSTPKEYTDTPTIRIDSIRHVQCRDFRLAALVGRLNRPLLGGQGGGIEKEGDIAPQEQSSPRYG